MEINWTLMSVWGLLGLAGSLLGLILIYKNHLRWRGSILASIEQVEADLSSDIMRVGEAELKQTPPGRDLLQLSKESTKPRTRSAQRAHVVYGWREKLFVAKLFVAVVTWLLLLKMPSDAKYSLPEQSIAPAMVASPGKSAAACTISWKQIDAEGKVGARKVSQVPAEVLLPILWVYAEQTPALPEEAQSHSVEGEDK